MQLLNVNDILATLARCCHADHNISQRTAPLPPIFQFLCTSNHRSLSFSFFFSIKVSDFPLFKVFIIFLFFNYLHSIFVHCKISYKLLFGIIIQPGIFYFSIVVLLIISTLYDIVIINYNQYVSNLLLLLYSMYQQIDGQ